MPSERGARTPTGIASEAQEAAGPTHPREVIAQVTNVSKWFGDHQVLRDVSLSIRRHEVVVLIGPSGSGKTTLLRTVNGLETVDRGTVTVADTMVAEAA